MFPPMETRLNPREQGDWGELAALTWLLSRGASVYRPVFHSPGCRLGRRARQHTMRVEAKTTTHQDGDGGWSVTISTAGGNQSWAGLVKYFDPRRCDYFSCSPLTAANGLSRPPRSPADRD
jgi:hypothetical protein